MLIDSLDPAAALYSPTLLGMLVLLVATPPNAGSFAIIVQLLLAFGSNI